MALTETRTVENLILWSSEAVGLTDVTPNPAE